MGCIVHGNVPLLTFTLLRLLPVQVQLSNLNDLMRLIRRSVPCTRSQLDLLVGEIRKKKRIKKKVRRPNKR